VGLTYHLDAFGEIRAGDEVVDLFGANVPFVLRKEKEEGGKYEMVNVAFLPRHEGGRRELVEAPEGTTVKDIWNDLEAYGLKEYVIV
jgi:hypothetical protein